MLTAVIAVLFSACEKEKETGPQPSTPSTPISSFANGVFVVNEGGFNAGNANISFYNNSTQTITNNVFSSVNNNLPLGDIAQTMQKFGDKIFIVVNNSSKIEVVNLFDFKSVATISNMGSPRFIGFINSSKAYVTDLFNNKIHIINPSTYTKTGEIAINGWTEDICLVADTAYVTNWDEKKLYLINTKTDAIITSLNIAEGAAGMVKDKNNHLWISCSGNAWATPKVFGKIYKFNPYTRSFEKEIDGAAVQQNPSKICLDKNNENIYYLSGNVYKMSVNASSLPTQTFVATSTFTYYGLGVNPLNDEVFVGDAVDFSQNGKVYIYSSTGSEKVNFSVGVSPNGFLFN